MTVETTEKRAYQLGVLLPDDLRPHYSHACSAVRRSMSMQAVVLIEEWLKRDGYLVDENGRQRGEIREGVEV